MRRRRDAGGLKVLNELGGMSLGHGDQEPTRGLRVERDFDDSFGKGLFDGNLVLQIIAVSLAPAGDIPLFGETRRAMHNRELLRLDNQGDAAAAGYPERVPEDSESRDVGAGVNGVFAHDCRRGGVESRHERHGFVDAFLRSFSLLESGGDDARAQGLRQNERVPFLHADVAENFVRMNDPRDGHAVFDFFVDNAVASYNNRAALFDFIGAAFENLAKDFHLHLTLWEANDVHRRFGFSTHGVNVAQRIRGGDLTEDIGIVNDGREKIHRVDDGQIGTQTKYPGVVGRFRSDEHIGVVEFGQFVQDLHEVGWAELSGSTRGLDLLCKSHGWFFPEPHKFFPSDLSARLLASPSLGWISNAGYHRL